MENIGYRSAEISWKTTDDAESRIKVWESTSFREVYSWRTEKGKEHKVRLEWLSANREYTYQIYTENSEVSEDVISDVYSFKTKDLYEITDIKVENIGYRSAEISWKTTDDAESRIKVWESPSFREVYSWRTEKGKEHKVRLEWLSANREYTYQIYTENSEVSEDIISDVYSFKTKDLYEITDIKVENIGYRSAEISWKTTDDAESRIKVWESSSFREVYSWRTEKGKEHKVRLEWLSANREYTYREYTYQIYTENSEVSEDVISDVYSFKTMGDGSETEDLYKITDIKV